MLLTYIIPNKRSAGDRILYLSNKYDTKLDLFLNI
jgi:hypothetical protein